MADDARGASADGGGSHGDSDSNGGGYGDNPMAVMVTAMVVAMVMVPITH